MNINIKELVKLVTVTSALSLVYLVDMTFTFLHLTKEKAARLLKLCLRKMGWHLSLKLKK